MKYLGIDYGTKRIGLAVSDEEGMMAYPLSILDFSDVLAHDISELVDRENVGEIVIGHSRDSKGDDNRLMDDIKDLVGQISLLISIPVHIEPEDFTSVEASRLPGYGGHAKRNQANKKGTTRAKKYVDDSAAALILQRFLDKQA